MERRKNTSTLGVFGAFCALFLFFIFLVGGGSCGMSSKKLERDFQSGLIKELKQLFPGCVVLKNDSSYIQGIPDLLVLFNDRWAMLEVKRSSSASHRPNQEYYVDLLDEMSFSRFICPENKEEVLHELESTFQS
jgi:hypothetical protein